MRTTFIGLALATILPAAAFADDARPAKPDCTCRAPAGRYELGETACLFGRVHVCEMVQNVTSWRSTGAACPEASLSLPFQRGGWTGEARPGGDRPG